MSAFSIVGLTGPSGSGKSYAAGYLSGCGFAVIDADQTARAVVEPGSPCLADLAAAFPDSILNPDGSLNRRKLADLCFSDPARQKQLNAITHPYILRALTTQYGVLEKAGKRCCIVEAGALFESDMPDRCDRIIFITANRPVLVARIVQRDGISAAQAETRLNAQTDPESVRDRCDVFLENNGTLAEFERKLEQLAGQLNVWYQE